MSVQMDVQTLADVCAHCLEGFVGTAMQRGDERPVLAIESGSARRVSEVVGKCSLAPSSRPDDVKELEKNRVPGRLHECPVDLHVRPVLGLGVGRVSGRTDGRFECLFDVRDCLPALFGDLASAKAFNGDAGVVEISSVVLREFTDDETAATRFLDGALGLEPSQCVSHRCAADLKLFSYCIHDQALAWEQCAGQQCGAEALVGQVRKRSAAGLNGA